MQQILINYNNKEKNQNTKPLSKEESQRLINNTKKQEEIQDKHKMYNLIKQDEKNKEINKSWWGKLNLLGYK